MAAGPVPPSACDRAGRVPQLHPRAGPARRPHPLRLRNQRLQPRLPQLRGGGGHRGWDPHGDPVSAAGLGGVSSGGALSTAPAGAQPAAGGRGGERPGPVPLRHPAEQRRPLCWWVPGSRGPGGGGPGMGLMLLSLSPRPQMAASTRPPWLTSRRATRSSTGAWAPAAPRCAPSSTAPAGCRVGAGVRKGAVPRGGTGADGPVPPPPQSPTSSRRCPTAPTSTSSSGRSRWSSARRAR